MHIVRAGSGKPPLVFVHGFACSHGDWRAQIEHFAPRHRVIACDLRGHGQTPGAPEDASIETFGADVAQLLAGEKLEHAVLVGHSMGCRVVLQAMLHEPKRVGALVLIDGSRMAVGDPKAAAKSAAAAIAALGYPEWMRRFIEAMFVASSDPKLRSHTVARALRLPEPFGAALFPRLNAWDAAKMENAFKSVEAPTLVIQSTKMSPERVRVSLAQGDTSPYLELVRRLVPAARVEIVTGVGHFSQLEAAGIVNQLIEGFVEGYRGG